MMKIRLIYKLLLPILWLSCTGAKTKQQNIRPFMVMELFTSEGCSSCPPADALLGRYGMDTVRNGVAIFPLAFHVDYWNHLGWRDSFSSSDYSDRQRHYAQMLHLPNIYTPQLVVNGTTQFVGSEEGTLYSTLVSAYKMPVVAQFEQLNSSYENNNIRVQYALSGNVSGCEIHFALVSPHSFTKVMHGENRGRLLTHTNVVRSFTTQPAMASGIVHLSVPLSGTLTLIAYVQHTQSGQIIAATRAYP